LSSAHLVCQGLRKPLLLALQLCPHSPVVLFQPLAVLLRQAARHCSVLEAALQTNSNKGAAMSWAGIAYVPARLKHAWASWEA